MIVVFKTGAPLEAAGPRAAKRRSPTFAQQQLKPAAGI